MILNLLSSWEVLLTSDVTQYHEALAYQFLVLPKTEVIFGLQLKRPLFERLLQTLQTFKNILYERAHTRH